ncbi:bifunctional riboflavin kinase/FAD synthetase [Sinosporangium siamense]|uniref:Riboflavin biosynthesis protein n=1 Tax=Sinosporangium siamense TaxID=1367973 RepID=A0A919RDM9_9ACTN|nr:bifunctional riboflavin kinase/FAD synthetase [Sinosporangium siamense]GII89844.1 riboflavin biosynthesis protein [Sinosporangium siamense]
MLGWHGLDEVPGDWGCSVVTIGVFDGVHLGHRRVIERGAARARELGSPLVLVTFDPPPAEVVKPGSRPARLTTARHRTELLAELGVDVLCVVPFTVEFSRLSPEEFAQTVLADRLRASAVVVGADFHFGHMAAGDLETLRTLGDKHDFTVEGVPLVTGTQTVSSSLVRDHLVEGDVEAAARALGRPHRVEGIVVRGYQRGRTLGFPTANVESPPQTAIPADGVYAGWLRCLPVGNIPAAYGGARWPAAISVGTNPTFDGVPRTVEAYALDHDDLDLYGAHVAVEFGARLRDNLRFDSIEALVAQIHADVVQVRVLTAS